MKTLLPIIMATLFLAAVLVGKAMRQLPPQELRRRARRGQDIGLYRLYSYGPLSKFALGLIGVSGFVVFVSSANRWWQDALASIAAAWAVAAWRGPEPNGLLWKISIILASWLAKVLAWIPLAPAGISYKHYHTGLFEKDDLIDLLDQQRRQPDSRINDAELQASVAVLSFSGKRVTDAMIPLPKAKLVKADDHIGPHLLDEMHKSTADCFIVVKNLTKGSKPEALGTLYLKDALAYAEGGKVKDAMTMGIAEIDEDTSLIQALSDFLTKKCHVAAIKNGFDEMVGVLTLQDVLEQIFGPRKTKTVGGDKITPDESKSSSKSAR